MLFRSDHCLSDRSTFSLFSYALLEEIKCCDAFHVYAKRYLEPATGFLVAILYWLTWTIALGSEFTAAGLIMQNWLPNIPIWSWGLLFMILIFLTNFFFRQNICRD